MSTGAVIHEAGAARPATARDERAAAQPVQPLRILIVNGVLRDETRIEPRPVSLANALAKAEQLVAVAAADGPLRAYLDERVRYLRTDNAHTGWPLVTHELLLYMKQRRFDVVHAFGATCGAVAAVATRASRTRCVRIVTHDSRAFGWAPRWVAGPMVRRCADHFIVDDPQWEASLGYLGVDPTDVSRIPPDSPAGPAELALYRRLTGREPAPDD